MQNFLHLLNELFRPKLSELGPWVVQWLDILIVAFLIFRILVLAQGTRARPVMLGFVAFIVLLLISGPLGFKTLHWVLDKVAVLGPVALVILFLPELRHGLEGLGKIGKPIELLVSHERMATTTRTIGEITRAVIDMAEERVGALIIIERTASLADIARNGVELQAMISAPLVESIFYEGNPLHDGAVIVRGDTLVAAGCRLPLSESSRLDQNVHMRHRAAVGVTEASDCLAIAVSEERGTVSWSSKGDLRRLATAAEIREVLIRELGAEEHPEQTRSRRRAERRAAAAAASTEAKP